MKLVTTVHLHNVPSGREDTFAEWFDSTHRSAVSALPGFKAMDRYELAAEQVMSDIAQPWRFVNIYEYESADLNADVPMLGRLVNEARALGYIDDAGENERILTYAMYSDWVSSANHRKDEPLSGVSVLLGNFTPGREAEYHKWYDEVHCPEVTQVPGKVAMKRGKLASVQIEPRRFTYGGELVFCAQQTDNLGFTIADFAARARGTSSSGVTFEPRSTAGSFARTVHYFRKISGTRFWDGGIAYAGDLSVYPELRS